MEQAHRIKTVDIHHLNFADGFPFHDVPALVAKDMPGSHPVSDIFIRHFRSWLPHMCRHALSPSILSLLPSQQASANAPALADLRVYVTFAAGGKFKMYYNGKLFLEPDSAYTHWRLYAAYISVSRGGAFSFVMENVSYKQFIGCFGSNVCTGFNDEQNIICTRDQPPDGWMLPSSRFTFQVNAPPPAKNCSISSESSIWSSFVPDASDHQCLGLSAVPAAFDAISCSIACCSTPSCTRFQWCGGGICNITLGNVPKCWIGHSTNCQVVMPGWVSGVLRSAPSTSGWHRALPMGVQTTFRTVEVGLDKRAQWLWPPTSFATEPQMFCKYSIP
jgi:hypothetical protein